MAEIDTSARDAEIRRREEAAQAESDRIQGLQDERAANRERIGGLRGGRLRQGLERLSFFAKGGESQFETPLGDRLPPAPNLVTDQTGIVLPGEEEARTPTELGQRAVEEEFATEEARFAAAQENQQRAEGVAGDIQASTEATTADIEETREDLAARQEDFDARLAEQSETLQDIPNQITSEFERLREEFGAEADASFDRLDVQREAALAGVMQGRSQAMEAAVQGVQGNVNNQIAQIQANTSLTASQKQSMISQVRLQGATAMGPIIGASVLAFNQLAADVATKFGSITGQLEGIGLQVKGQLIGMQGEAFASAQIEVGRMTNQLLDIQASSDAAYANSQGQLLAIRSSAEMAGNGLMVELLPAMATPYLDLTGATNAAASTAMTLMMDQYTLEQGTYAMELNVASLRENQGTFLSRLIEGFFSGFAVAGNKKGGILGAFGSVSGGQGPQI